MSTVEPPRLDREPAFDNLRLALLCFVVLGHLLELFGPRNPSTWAAYLFVYSFHVPLFAFVAGAFAQRAPTREGLRKLLTRVVAPLVLFDLLFAVADHLLNGSFLVFPEPWVPYKHLWFLLSLVCWKLMLLATPKRWWAVAIAVAIGVAAGFFDDLGRELSLRRTLVFYPFFVLGAVLPRAAVAAAPRAWLRCAAGAVVIAAAVAAYVWGDELPSGILLAKHGYAALDLSSWEGSLQRLAAYATAAGVGGAVVLLIPRRRFAFTALGARAMYPFLLHQALPLAIAASISDRFVDLPLKGWAIVLLCAGAAVAVSVALALRPIAFALRPLAAPRWKEALVAAGVAAAAFVAILAAVPSLNHASADRATFRELRKGAPRAIGSGGLAVALPLVPRVKAIELAADPGGYDLTCFRANRRLFAKTVQTDAGGTGRLRLQGKSAAAGCDLLLIELSAPPAARRLEAIHFKLR